ncbi:MAG: PilN domain-containing protein [Planctomycetota bacterium]
MITVNLLPEDFRRRERTPIRIFAATVAAAVVVAGMSAVVAYLWFGKLATAEDLVARLEEDRTALEPQLKHHGALTVEITETKKWQQALLELRNSKIPWSAKLDQFIDLVSQTGDQGKYLMWFSDFNVQQSIDNKQSGGTVFAKGMSAGDDVGKVATFIGDIKRHDFFKEFSNISGPEGKVSDSEVVEFPVTLTLAARDPKKLDAANTKKTPQTPAPTAPAKPEGSK